MIILVIGGLLIGVASVLDLIFRLRMKEMGYKWALLKGGAFDYSEYHKVGRERDWPAWPVYVMWIAVICGIALLIGAAFTYLGTSPTRTNKPGKSAGRTSSAQYPHRRFRTFIGLT